MTRRKKKGEPEMLIVSFCDIVTIATAAMFFVLIITVQEAIKIPVFRPTPRARILDKDPVFFECRQNEVFYIDKKGLDTQLNTLMAGLNPSVKTSDLNVFLKALRDREISDGYYRLNPNYLLKQIMALEPLPTVHGDKVAALSSVGSRFTTALAHANRQTQYVVFLVRDDSFTIFRSARSLVDKLGFDLGWELLAPNEPISFGENGTKVPGS